MMQPEAPAGGRKLSKARPQELHVTADLSFESSLIRWRAQCICRPRNSAWTNQMPVLQCAHGLSPL